MTAGSGEEWSILCCLADISRSAMCHDHYCQPSCENLSM